MLYSGTHYGSTSGDKPPKNCNVGLEFDWKNQSKMNQKWIKNESKMNQTQKIQSNSENSLEFDLNQIKFTLYLNLT